MEVGGFVLNKGILLSSFGIQLQSKQLLRDSLNRC